MFLILRFLRLAEEGALVTELQAAAAALKAAEAAAADAEARAAAPPVQKVSTSLYVTVNVSSLPLRRRRTSATGRTTESAFREHRPPPMMQRDEGRTYSASFAGSVFNLMNAILGSGVLGLPYAMRLAGWLTYAVLITLMATLAVVSVYEVSAGS